MNKPLLTSAQLETLARRLARQHMVKAGQVPPTVLLTTDQDLYECRTSGLATAAAKDQMVQMTRLLAISHRAVAVTVILECWVRIAQVPGNGLGERQECVVIVTEGPSGPRALLLGIERQPTGAFMKFVRLEVPGLSGLAGRFAGLLPRATPTPDEVRQARLQLALAAIPPDGTRHRPTSTDPS